MPYTVHLVAAARPNFMKVAPLYHQLAKSDWCEPALVHTGQHYDLNMSDCFFNDLGLPEPDIHLGVGSGTHGEQTARILMAYEAQLLDSPPDCVIVVGDVNSTMACTLAAAKLLIPVAHLEAGLRSYDRTMPEEINRIVTDSLADILWPPSQDGVDNLLAEGIPADRINLVGNIMIDSYEMLRDSIEQIQFSKRLGLNSGEYGVVTLHRPSNVDHPEKLKDIINRLTALSHTIPLVFPLHPRTRKELEKQDLLSEMLSLETIAILDPTSYVGFMSLVADAALVITDSGGIQEETSYLGIPCLTLRENTERPVTLDMGTNRLIKPHQLEKAVSQAITTGRSKTEIPLWDGKTAKRVETSLKSFLNQL